MAAVAVPPKNQPPLIVDTNRVKPGQITAQLLAMIARWYPQILIRRRVVDYLELAEGPAFEIGQNVPRSTILDEEGAEPLIPKAHYHAPVLRESICTTQPYKLSAQDVAGGRG